jgi:hypothetical protein
MHRFSLHSDKPSAKPPATQYCYFIMMMLLGNYQILSGNMSRLQGFLRTGEELLHMSDKSKQSLWREYAEQHANLTQRQRRKLMLFRFRAFLWARLLGKQSSQHAGIRLHLGVLRHLMTKCIPRIRISPIRMPERPVKEAWQLLGSVVYDPSGFMYNGRNHDWSPYHRHITAITSHSKQPLIALMHSDGQVSIGKTDDSYNPFLVIHYPKKGEEATAIAFHPSREFIAVATLACIIVYKISPYLKPELHFKVSFYESGSFCPRSQFSANALGWNSDGTFLTAIAKGSLSVCYFIDPVKIQVIGGFHGWTKYAELCLFREDILPDCSCFSVDGKLVMTAYPDGTLMVRSAEHTVVKGLTLSCLKITNKFLPGQVGKIVPHPYNPSVFAIGVSRGWSHSSVLIVLVDHDGSVTITATILDAKRPHFHKDLLLVSSGNKILFHRMNRCNIPCLVTEFHLQRNGTMHVEIDVFCVIKTPDGKVMLYYAHDGKSNLCTAEITLS